jgi:hypothetical protein
MNARIPVDRDKRTTGRSNGDLIGRHTKSMVMIGAILRGIDRLSPSLGARVAASVFLTPRRTRLPERESAWLKLARPETFAAGRFRLAGHRWSESGEPVLLVHGWEGRGSQLGGLALALAGAGFQPITVDLPAHGSTPGTQTNLLEFAEVVSAMVRHLRGVAGIVAHSFGAAGTTVAMRDELNVGRLVYVAPSEDFDRYPRIFGQWLGLPHHLSERMKRSVEGRLGASMADLRGRLLAPRMAAPLLVVHDEDDADVPWQDGKTYSEAWPDSRLLTTRGLGHHRVLRDASVMASVADFFLEKNPGPGVPAADEEGE